MDIVIWFGVYISPVILIILGVYITYGLVVFLHRIEDNNEFRGIL